MKHIRIYTIFIFCLLVSASCDDELNLAPFNAIETGEALESASDFENAIRGVYGGLRETTYYGGWMFSMPDVLADNLIISSEGRTSKQTYHYWNYSGNSTWLGLWENAYVTVLAANIILENIDKLPEGDFRNNIRAEALALRALAHFDLARVFSTTPPLATSEDLGIPYMTSSEADQRPDRPTSVQETYDKIAADLEEAKGLIAEDNGVGRLNYYGVSGLLSRFYLYTQEYDQVIANATEALKGGTLASIAEFPQIWTDETDAGVLFKLKVTEQDTDPDAEDDVADIGTEYSQTGATGVRSEYVVDYAFYQQYTDDDVRKATYFSTSEFAGKLFNHIAKYFGRPVGDANVVDAKIVRVAEVLLNRAEAYAASGDDANALADLNMLRQNRYTTFTPGNETGQALMDAIALERRKELAFEGHRFFDLKRKGLPVNRSGFGDEADGTGRALPEDVRLLEARNYKFLLPIPQEEINANPNMQQNPDY